MTMLANDPTTLHVRFAGRSEELPLAALNLRPDATDEALRSALALRYECAQATLDEYVIVREPEAIIVRPVAIYG